MAQSTELNFVGLCIKARRDQILNQKSNSLTSRIILSNPSPAVEVPLSIAKMARVLLVNS